MHAAFYRNGYTVIRSLFTPDQIEYYIRQLDQLSVGRGTKWTLPDGVCQHRPFWDVIFQPAILEAVRSLLGENIKFLQHDDLHVGFSSFHWHRDSVCRTYGEGPDWEERNEPYQLLRVGIYLQESSGGFRLGLVPGSQQPGRLPEKERRLIERTTSGLSKVRTLLGANDPLAERADWIPTSPGDCILFDPRTVHTGSEFEGTKYSIFVAFGVENGHFRNHYNYYRYLRDDLKYRALHPELAERLQAAGLYAGEQADVPAIKGAWMPSRAFSAVARQFK